MNLTKDLLISQTKPVKNNARLDSISYVDGKEFPVVATVTSGMEDNRKVFSHCFQHPVQITTHKTSPEQ